MRRLLPLAVIALAGCEPKAPAPAPEGTGTTRPVDRPVPAPAQPAPAAAIGSVSSLTAETSPLTATVSDFAVERTGFGTRVQLAADTLFDFDKASLTPVAETNLARAAELVRQGGAGKVTITGYTDAKGDDAYNLALSQRRAAAVATSLRARPGLGDRAFVAEGKGEADPIAPNETADGQDDAQGRARNRRVTLDIPK